MEAVDGVLPLPDRTLALRTVQETLYRCMAGLAPDEAGRAWALNNLGVALSALGRREEALAATQEAADLYRELVAAEPGAFLPDLARSLGAHGAVLRELGRHAEAADAFGEGVRILAPFFRRLPQAFAGLMADLVNDYRDACRAAGRKPKL